MNIKKATFYFKQLPLLIVMALSVSLLMSSKPGDPVKPSKPTKTEKIDKSKKAEKPVTGSFRPIEFVRDSLPNGLQVIYNVDKSAPVVATVLHYRVGSRNEIQGKTGYAHFFEHLMFEATDDIPRSTIDKYVNEAGGELNAHTSFDETVFFFKVPSNEIKLALWMESERMHKLHVDSIGVATQKGVVSEELKMRTENQPYGTLLMKMCNNLFPGCGYEWETIGYLKDLQEAKIQDFKEFYDKYYRPDNCVLVISGDINIEETKQYVREYFGVYPKQSPLPTENFQLKPLEKEYRETVEDSKAQLPAVFIAYRGPKLGEDDYYPVSMLTMLLAQGESSRMYQRLVDKDQIAVETAVEPFSLQYSGAILLIGIPSPGKPTADVEKTMYDEINKLITNGITDEEFQKVKNQVESDFVSDKKSVLSKCYALAKYYSYYRNPNLINTEIDKYNKVTKDDIIRVAKKYFSTDKRVVLTYVPAEHKTK
jgi:zinc protease